MRVSILLQITADEHATAYAGAAVLARLGHRTRKSGWIVLASVVYAGLLEHLPFGNKEAAVQLGARYRAGGWYAPPGVSLGAFRERGWL